MPTEPTFIPVANWATYAICPEGKDIEIAFYDADSKHYILKLAPMVLGVLFSSIPRMMEIALQRRSGDADVSHALPLAEWAVAEINDGAFTLITLAAPDGFKVAFAAPAALAKALGAAICKGSGAGSWCAEGAAKPH